MENFTANRPLLSQEDCNGCGDCVDICPQDGLYMEGERAAINSQVECNYCGDCETVCPTAALACPVEVLLLPGRPAPYPAARTGERTGSGSGKGKGGTPHTGKKVEKTK